MNLIDISRITKDYGQGQGVFDVSFSVRQGEVLGFLGPNGAGKTTTIRQLMGFIKPDSGRLSIEGKDCFEQAEQIQGILGYLPGEIAFIDSMSGMEFIAFVAKMKKMKDLGRAKELIDIFELNPSGKLKKMSKGMKQKIGIICAFMNQNAKIYILDEPSNGLDPVMQNRFIELVLSEKRKGKTILMSSHMFEEIERTCDRAAIIRHGRIVAVEDMDKLRAGKQKIFRVAFENAQMAESFGQAYKQMGCKVDGGEVTVSVGKDVDRFIKKVGEYTVIDLKIHQQSLEEFFLHFYGEGEVQ